MAEEQQQVLMSVEAEALIEALEVFPIKNIGSPKWQKQHEYIEKLNMQALLSASAQEEEFVKETLITLGKVTCLIEDLLSVEIWKQNVFNVIVQTNFKPKTSIPLYMVLYHEATLANLLETILFHKESLESAEDATLDLLDYCYRKLSASVGRKFDFSENLPKDGSAVDTLKELEKQQEKMDFEIAVKVVSILRYLTDALDSLPLSMASRMMNTHNIPCLLVELVENPPWTKSENGKTTKYIEGKWEEMKGPEVLQLTKIEAQVWLSIYNLLMNPECLKKYNFNSFNKAQVVKLKSYMTEVLLDQLPMLCDMRRYLEQLSMSDPNPPKLDLVLEQLPEIRDRIISSNEGKWKGIAKYQMKHFFDPSNDEIKQQAQRLADTYNFDVMDSLLTEVPKCCVCGNEATKRCSRCRVEWYCKRECQVKHWPKHKQVCDTMSGNVNSQKSS
uniref:Zinc finger MYND domain-containing protein 10 n=1 Tax=Phallusia mammillata TaxID=59560 RepID=A0A6F9DY75_9ASCI|nr:zinc finger MYND domain-containing protein 10-like [Phallusia mammillata]